MPTFSKHIPDPEVKAWMDSIVEKTLDENPHFSSRGEALKLIFDVYVKGIEILDRTIISKSAQEVLDEVNCYYLKLEDLEFKCFEFFKRKKKPDLLGSDTDKVLLRCETCRQGEADEIRKQYQNKLRGQNIKGILQLIHLFQKLAKDGVPSTIYFCNRIADSQIFTGLKTITCTLVNAKVSIDKCKELPCEYFEEYAILIEQEFPAQTLKLIEGIADDYKAIEDLTPRKEIDVEQVDQDVQGEEKEASEG